MSIVVTQNAMLGVRSERGKLRLAIPVKAVFSSKGFEVRLPWGAKLAGLESDDLLSDKGMPVMERQLRHEFYDRTQKAKKARRGNNHKGKR